MTKIPLDKNNRMLRFGFGKNEGNWFLRIDLWFFGIRFNKKPKPVILCSPFPEIYIPWAEGKKEELARVLGKYET